MIIEKTGERWAQANKRHIVPAHPVPAASTMPLAVSVAPELPGIGDIVVTADILPLIVIPDMPASAYPKYIRPLTGYTLAELAVRNPHLLASVWEAEIIHAALLTVATRAGSWASLGVTPVAQDSVASRAVRWSSSKNAMIVRPAELGDGTEIWRHCLASSPGIPTVAVEIGPVLAGAAPQQFLSGAALLLQSGEVYAMHYLERAINSYYRANLSSVALSYLKLEQRATWDLLSAAAIGGFRASVIRALATDSVYVLGAHLRISAGGPDAPVLQKRLADAIAAHGAVTHGIGSAEAHERSIRPTGPSTEVDNSDLVSVADTEVEEQAYQRPAPAQSGTTTPTQEAPPDIDPATVTQLHEAIRAVPQMAQPVASLIRNVNDTETVQW
jgi:hypothetical protein